MFASLVTRSNMTDSDNTRAVAIYTRVSTREQSELGYSVRDQEVKCKKYIEFIDEDKSINKCIKYLDEGQSSGPNKDANLVISAFKDIKKDLNSVEILHSDRGS